MPGGIHEMGYPSANSKRLCSNERCRISSGAAYAAKRVLRGGWEVLRQGTIVARDSRRCEAWHRLDPDGLQRCALVLNPRFGRELISLHAEQAYAPTIPSAYRLQEAGSTFTNAAVDQAAQLEAQSD
jgi:hypothetical protein